MPKVYGATVDQETRCTHYNTPFDVIAIKFKCCHKYYPCFKCHNESENIVRNVGIRMNLMSALFYVAFVVMRCRLKRI